MKTIITIQHTQSIHQAEIFGLAGGVSFMFRNKEGKHFIKCISDLSYIVE